MFTATTVLEIELSRSLPPLSGLLGYGRALCLVRSHGEPLGYVELPVRGGQVAENDLRGAIEAQLSGALERQQLRELLQPQPFDGPWPSITAAVCTRNRAGDLAQCLAALAALEYPGELEILVVDNAPSDESTASMVRERFPSARYVRESRPGLDWARNRAILEARGEIVAYTDDDVVVDRLWARAIGQLFAENPSAMAMTGLVVPHEIETAAQLAFETYGGFGRGFEQRWFGINRAGGERAAGEYTATGKFGTGANMAYRRSLFERIGGFDPALDVGTVTNGGGDLEMFFRVLKAGFALVYEPRAIVRHRHRRDEAALHSQIANNGVGFYAYLVRCFLHFPDERLPILRQGVWWFWYWYIYRFCLSFVRPVNTTRALILAELRGGIAGLGRYQRARAKAKQQRAPSDLPDTLARPAQTARGYLVSGTAVRVVDLAHPLAALDDVGAYPNILVVVQHNRRLIGRCAIANWYEPVSVARLRTAIVEHLGAALRDVLQPAAALATAPVTVSPELAVSIIVIARGRLADLQRCLQQLGAQQPSRPTEIIVVTPCSASSALLQVTDRSCAVLVHEPRPGLFSALGAGLKASTGAVVACIDESAHLPSTWLAELLAPLQEPSVVAVTGATLPLKLDTVAQNRFERYAAAAHGFATDIASPAWLAQHAEPPRWTAGALANSAFRRAALAELPLGLTDASAETYLFDGLLRRGGSIAYAPQAYIWREHTPNAAALYRWSFARGNGRAAFYGATLLRNGERRALRLLGRLGATYARSVFSGLRLLLRGRDKALLGVTLVAMLGSAAAPWSLLAAWLASAGQKRCHIHKTNLELPWPNPAPVCDDRSAR